MSISLPQRRLVSQDDASFTARADVPRSVFSGSWTRKTAFDAGYLVPFLVDEILPGDHMKYDVTAYIRMQTPLFPIFDSQRVDTFFFFIPNRILWADWTRCMGEQSDPSQSIAVSIPTLTLGGAARPDGSLYDHLGLPSAAQAPAAIVVQRLPMIAYNRIWSEWFRDQNLQAAAPETGAAADYVLRRRAKAHDYFTSALPWPQKFTPPSVAIGGIAPIMGLGIQAPRTATSGAVSVWDTAGGGISASYDPHRATDVTNQALTYRMDSAGGTGIPLIYADLSAASGVAVNTLRQAFMVQSLLERDARGGTRYVELIKSHFGVQNPDYRLQRPEYIGGGQSALNITPVAQTAPATGTTVGALGAAGTSVGSHNASYAATEHGWIIGLINVRTELSYYQGLHRMWTRSTRYDYYWPSLALLGEQAILRREIYCTGTVNDDNQVFGYQERWHEYRTRYSDITGAMRPDVGATLDEWHLAQEFGSFPTLGPTFIEERPPVDRVLAAGSAADGQQYLADILIKRRATRPIPTFGTPATLGRF